MRRSFRLFVVLLCILIGTAAGFTSAAAASCNIRLSSNKEKVKVGDTFVVNVEIEGEETISGVEVLLTYDAEMFEKVSMSPAVSGGEGTLMINDPDIPGTSRNISYVVKFKSIKAGVSQIQVGSEAQIYNEESGQSMSVGSNVLTVNAESKEELSSDTSLKSLKISGGSMKPRFSKDHLDYKVTVKKETKKLVISADPSDQKAKVEVKGQKELREGENKITVIVTAQNGDTREYTINAVYAKEKKETEQAVITPEEANNQETVSMKPIQAKIVDGLVTLTTHGTFVVHPMEQISLLPAGYQPVTITIDGNDVTAYENLEYGTDFVLLYASYDGAEPCLYQYDKIEQTISRFNHLLVVPDAGDFAGLDPISVNGNDSKVYVVLLIVLAVLCTIFMGTTAILYVGSRRRRRR